MLKSAVEFVEQQLGDALLARTESLNDLSGLGPPDLCHLVKHEKASGQTQSTYHWVVGADCSTSASCAVYMNALSYQLSADPPQTTNNNNSTTTTTSSGTSGRDKSSTQQHWTLRSGTYCTYNPFRRLDMHIEVKIPGGVDAYAIAGDYDKRLPTTDEMWDEVYLACILRALFISLDSPILPLASTSTSTSIGIFGQQYASGFVGVASKALTLRFLNPLPTKRDETLFLKTASKLFTSGPLLGCDSPSNGAGSDQVGVSLVNNHLTKGLISYFAQTRRYQTALKFFEALLHLDPEMAALVAHYKFLLNLEHEAVKLLVQSQLAKPLRSSVLCLAQARFLHRQKHRLEEAEVFYRYAVEIAAGDAEGWLGLAECYVDMGDEARALACLNTCPMTLPLPSSSSPNHLQASLSGVNGGVWENYFGQTTYVQPARVNMPVNDLSPVPVGMMEGLTEVGAREGLLNDPLTFLSVGPKFKDACDVQLYKLQGAQLRGNLARAYSVLAKIVKKSGWESLLDTRARVFVMEDEYKEMKKELEEQALDERDDTDGDLDAKQVEWKGSSQLTVAMFDDKRLCERWLDSLFMVLYGDLRAYTVFKAEIQHVLAEMVTQQQAQSPSQAQLQSPIDVASVYQRTPLEWDLLGDLCARMHRWDDARLCWTSYLRTRFNVRIHAKLLGLLSSTSHHSENHHQMQRYNETPVHAHRRLLTILSHVYPVLISLDRFHINMDLRLQAYVVSAVKEVGVEKAKAMVDEMKQVNKSDRGEIVMRKFLESVERGLQE